MGVLVVSVVVLAGVKVARSGPVQSELKAGQEAPSLELHIGGDSIEVFQPDGNTLLVFYSTTCEWCQRSVPTYRAAVSEDCGLDIVLAVVDLDGEAVRQWWAADPWDTGEGVCGDVSVGAVGRPFSYPISVTPTHYLIRDGRIVHMEEGGLLEMPSWLSER